MIKPSEIQIDIIKKTIVIIKHVPSGTTVTKQNSKSQLLAKNEAMDELEILVKLRESEAE